MKKNDNKNILMDKAYAFSLEIIEIYKYLTYQKREYVMAKQLLRSGTSIGALIKEAKFAQSRKDFLHKMNIALKEANETEYWLNLLMDSKYLNKNEFEKTKNEIQSLIKMLASTVKTTKQNLNQ